MTGAEREEVAATLEDALQGLQWYRDEHPDDEDDCDWEMENRINASVATVRGSPTVIWSPDNVVSVFVMVAAVVLLVHWLW